MSAVITQTSALAQLAGGSEAVGEIVLQPGTVIDARVLAVRENLARIIIAGLPIDVLTEVALQPGAPLKLAVSQTPDGNVRLAVVPPDTPRAQAGAPPPILTPGAAATAASVTLVSAVTPKFPAPPLVPAYPEALAIGQAVQTAAPKQASLSPLFANLPVIVASDRVPRQVQSAASQLLATRPALDGQLTADDLRQAFKKSGLFLEQTLARGAAPQGPPDLKAALVVFKQVLTNWLGQVGPTGQFSSATPNATPPVTPQPGATVPAPAVASAAAVVIRAQVPHPLAPETVEIRTQVASAPAPVVRGPIPDELVRLGLQLATREGTALLRPSVEPGAPERAAQTLAGQPPTAPRGSEPPPPFRGGAPAPQPIAAATIAPETPPASIGRQLLEQTDAALARQTLLQVASLPERPELTGSNQSNQPRWSFEIPFATPQGTAVAQFEIARDGGNETEASASSRVWRARFTLDVEPTGPVHALVSLVGEKTAVRMWAERPETAAQLRANAPALGEALRKAELEPGDILVGDGAPPQKLKPPAGRFLDRAT